MSMKHTELFRELNEEVEERYALSMERIETMAEEQTIKEPWLDYFKRTGAFILKIKKLVPLAMEDQLAKMSLKELQDLNYDLYEDIIGEKYESSYANPRYAREKLGKDYGQILSFLYTELRGLIVSAFECRLFDITIYLELFIELYNYFEEEDKYTLKDVKRAIYDFSSDYCIKMIKYRTRELLDKDLSFAQDIIRTWDLKDFRYLYQFGEYIGDNELQMADFLNQLPEEEIKSMAFTVTEGYRRGFEAAGIDLSKKSTVAIRYNLGFERMLYYIFEDFDKMGLEPILFRAAVSSVNKRQNRKIGYCSMGPNRQYDYDHRFDHALYMDKAYNKRKLESARAAFEQYKEAAAAYQNALAIKPDEFEIYYYIGAAYTEMRHYNDAIEAYRSALRIKSSDGELYYNLASIYAMLGRYDISIENLQKAVENNKQILEDVIDNKVFSGMRGREDFKQLISG